MLTPLMAAAQAGEEECVRLLLKAGADTSKVGGSQGLDALYESAMKGRVNIVKILLKGGASVNTTGLGGVTLLFTMAARGHSEIVKLLIDAGADPHSRDRYGATALIYAMNLPTVKVLLEAGVSADFVDEDGHTALHYLGRQGSSTAMICAIFKAGVNPLLLNKAGKTAAQIAREAGHSDAAKLLDMLAAKYKHTEENALEAKAEPSAVVPSDGVADLNVKMSSCVVDSTSDEVVVGLAEPKQDIAEERTQRVLLPCLNCQTLTHRRCARCRTAYICSRDCQVATLVEHRVECMEIYEGREKS